VEPAATNARPTATKVRTRGSVSDQVAIEDVRISKAVGRQHREAHPLRHDRRGELDCHHASNGDEQGEPENRQ
jgi:hypothetical protein